MTSMMMNKRSFVMIATLLAFPAATYAGYSEATGDYVSPSAASFTGGTITGALVLSAPQIMTSQTISADDTTPSVLLGSWFITSANTGSTTVTTFDDAATDQLFTVCGGSNTNPTMIANGGAFTLNGAFISLTLDTCVTFWAKTAATFVQRGPMTNVVQLSGRPSITTSGTTDYALRINQTLNSNASTTGKFYNGIWFDLTETDATGWLAANRYLLRLSVGTTDKFTILDTGAATGLAFIDSSADPADSGVLRCGNNVVCIAAENSTPGADGTITYSNGNIWAFVNPLSSTSTITGTTVVVSNTSSGFFVAGRSQLSAPANGQWVFALNNGSAGIGFDFATDNQLKLLPRAGTATAVTTFTQAVSSKGAFTNSTGAESTLTCAGGGGSATLTFASAFPLGAIKKGVTTRVTTALTGATGYTVGDTGASDPDMYGVAATATQGTTTTPTSQTVSVLGTQITAAGDVVITFTGANCTAGAIHVVTHYEILTADTAN